MVPVPGNLADSTQRGERHTTGVFKIHVTNVATNNTGTLTIVDVVSCNDATSGAYMHNLLKWHVAPADGNSVKSGSNSNYADDLCKTALRGGAHCVFLVCTSPIDDDEAKSREALHFSQRARAINNTVLRLPKTPRLSLASPYFVRRKKAPFKTGPKPLYAIGDSPEEETDDLAESDEPVIKFDLSGSSSSPRANINLDKI